MDAIDFSCKHHILIMDEDGSLQPMDEPYFRSEQIDPGTWLVRSEGGTSPISWRAMRRRWQSIPATAQATSEPTARPW